MFFYSPLLLIATQIIVESLPVSSSGHVRLVQLLFGTAPLPDFIDHFLHGPTLLIIMIYFFGAWFDLARRTCEALVMLVRVRCMSGLRDSQKRLLAVVLRVVGYVVAADLVTALCYFLFNIFVKHSMVIASPWVLLCGFMVTGCALITSASFTQSDAEASVLTFPKAIILGLVQGIAFFPGISRFGATVIAARWLGLSPRRSLQFSFQMFFPLIVAAFIGNGLPAALGQGGDVLLSGMYCWTYLVATVIAYVFFVGAGWIALRDKMWWFGVYMLFPIGLLLARL